MSNTKKPIKYPKINISYELVGTPSCLLADPDRYLKLFGTNHNSSTVVNLPMGSVNRSYYEQEYEYTIHSKNKIKNKNIKSYSNYTKSYENYPTHKERIPSFENRMKYSKSIEKMNNIEKNSKNKGGHSTKKRNLNINNNNDDENSYEIINNSSNGKENKKHYKNKKKKNMVNRDVQVLSSLNDEDDDENYHESKNKNNRNKKQNKINKAELSENIISTTIKINKLLIQITNQKNKIKEMANESYYNVTNSENNQNDISSNNNGINTNSNESRNNDNSNSNINNSNSNVNNSNNNNNSGNNVNNLKNNIKNNKNPSNNNKNKSNNSTTKKNKNKSSLTKKNIKNDLNLEKFSNKNTNNNNNENIESSSEVSKGRNSKINNRNKNRDNNYKYHKNQNSYVPETTHNKTSHKNDYSLNEFNSYNNSNKNINNKNIPNNENTIETYSTPFIKGGRRCIPCYTLLDERLHKNRNSSKSKKKKHKKNNPNSIDITYTNPNVNNEAMTPSIELNSNNDNNHNRAKSYKEENIKKNLDFENAENSNIKLTTENSIINYENYEEKSILKIDNLCKRGFNGPDIKKINQDNFFIYNNFNNNPDYVFMGVCDGHGLYGHFVSSFLANTLPQNMNDNILSKNISKIENISKEELEKIIKDTFITTNIKLSEENRIDITYSGSTCVSTLITPKKLICANVGDSRCILGKFNGEKWFSKNLSKDHKPNIPGEYDRIIKMGGRIETYKDNENNCFGPNRVWLKNEDSPGLAMSRSFGDEVAHSIGVISEPEIIENYFLVEDKFVIVGSDGLWEFISSDEVVNIVKDFYLKNDIQGAFETLFKESTKRWLIEEGVIDDITILIAFLKEKNK